jgi:hypothetical protein
MHEELESRIQAVLEAAFEQTLNRVRSELPEHLQNAGRSAVEEALREAREAAIRRARQETGEALRDAVLLIRQAGSVTAVVAALVEAAARFSGRAALLIHKQGRLLGFRVAGSFPDESRSAWEDFEISLAEAPALQRVAESRQILTSELSKDELSPALAEFLRSENASLFHVFPVLLRDQVLGILLAAGSAGRPDVDQAAIQLLTLAAEAWVEAVGSRRREPLGRRAAAASA